MARKKEQVRKTKNTQRRPAVRQLSVATQGAVALALGLGLAAPAPVEASIVYTDIADVTIQNGGYYHLNFTNDNTPQFTFDFQNGSYSGPYYSLTYSGPKVSANYSNGVAGTYFPIFGPTYAAFNLPKGTPIHGYNQSFYNNGFLAAEGKFSQSGFDLYFKAGQWIGKQGYAGLLFYDQDLNPYYGWVELSLSTDLSSLTIYGYAYENVADTAIAAGAVPAPSSLLLLATGALGVLAFRRRRRNKEQQPD